MAANVGSHNEPDLVGENGNHKEDAANNSTPVDPSPNGSTPMEVAEENSGAVTGPENNPAEDLTRMLVSLTGTASKVMSPQLLTRYTSPKIETEILELNLNEADTARYARWSRYEFKGVFDQDNIEFQRVPGKIKLYKDGAPDGFAPTLATVVLRRFEVRANKRREKLLAPMDVHHIMVHTGITKHPVLHELVAYVNKRVRYSGIEENDKLLITEDPEFDHTNYSNRDHVLHPDDFKKFLLMPTWENVSIETRGGKRKIVVEPEAADRAEPADPFDVESAASQEEDVPADLSKNQLDGSGDKDDESPRKKGEKKKKKASLSAEEAQMVKSKTVEEMKLALRRFQHDEAETRRWQEIQRREAEIKNKDKRIKKMIKEFEKEAIVVRRNQNNEKKRLALAKKQERIEKAQKKKQELEADLIRFTGRSTANPSMRQTSLEETIPYSPIKKAQEPVQDPEVNQGAGPSKPRSSSESSEENVVYYDKDKSPKSTSESSDENVVYYDIPVYIAKPAQLKKEVIPSKIWKQQVVRNTEAASRFWNSNDDARSVRIRSDAIAAMSDILAGVETTPVIQRLDGSITDQLAAADKAMRAARVHRRASLKSSTPKKKDDRVKTRAQKRVMSPLQEAPKVVSTKHQPAKRPRKSTPKKSTKTRKVQPKAGAPSTTEHQPLFSSTDDQDLLQASIQQEEASEGAGTSKKMSIERTSLAVMDTEEEGLDFEPPSSATETDSAPAEPTRVSVFDRLSPRQAGPVLIEIAEEEILSDESSDRERAYVGVPARERRLEEADTDVDEE